MALLPHCTRRSCAAAPQKKKIRIKKWSICIKNSVFSVFTQERHIFCTNALKKSDPVCSSSSSRNGYTVYPPKTPLALFCSEKNLVLIYVNTLCLWIILDFSFSNPSFLSCRQSGCFRPLSFCVELVLPPCRQWSSGVCVAGLITIFPALFLSTSPSCVSARLAGSVRELKASVQSR